MAAYRTVGVVSPHACSSTTCAQGDQGECVLLSERRYSVRAVRAVLCSCVAV